jgi:hypothetical protein
MASGIEIPFSGGAYYALRNVPHGDIRIKNIFQESLIHGGSFTSTHLRPMILLLIQAILFYTFYMAVAKMRGVGHARKNRFDS